METTFQRPTVAMTVIRLLVAVISLLFLFWAPLHLGLEIPLGFRVFAEPRIIPAFIVESVCGVVLAISAVALYTHRLWAWKALVTAHVLAFLGVILGMTALALGRGPRTVSNDIYHNILLILIVTNLVLLQRPSVQNALEIEKGDHVA